MACTGEILLTSARAFVDVGKLRAQTIEVYLSAEAAE
jgi:hypothetical protein